MIRDWRARLLHKGTSVSETAKAYRFLRAVLMTAADDRIIPRNPCRVRGAGEEKPDERPVLTLHQVHELADRMPRECFRVLVLLDLDDQGGYGVSGQQPAPDFPTRTGIRAGITRGF